jgi:hypothetical protein
MTTRLADKLPVSYMARPWELVHADGKLRLAYIIKYFGEGFPVGSFTGGRGYFATDAGVIETGEQVFRPEQFMYSWRQRPTASHLQKARERETNL